ncbi:MAG: cation-translocating P-type ATPase [Xanthomonadales bacterium]|nr:cation-translocating P-type ATPase [Xanthomonadales bacterium]
MTASRETGTVPGVEAAHLRLQGIATSVAVERLRRDGPNELPSPPRRGVLRVIAGVLGEPMFLLLVVAAGIYLVVGDLLQGLLLGGFAGLSIGLVVVQQSRSERALAALRALAAPVAQVVRDGELRSIPAREIVRGDLLVVAEGERVAADARLVRGSGLRVDESLLTGESLPVDKEAAAEPAPGAAVEPPPATLVQAGTLVVAGHGFAEVFATGAGTQAGRIGASLASIRSGPTPLAATIKRLVRVFAIAALLASAGVTLLLGLLRGEWLQGVLSGIALAMAMLPEEFPMVLTVFVAFGAWRLAGRQVLVRRMAAVETLGAASVLCLDKTGTLTINQQRVRALVNSSGIAELGDEDTRVPGAWHRLLQVAARASRSSGHDPLDAAVIALAGANGLSAAAEDILLGEFGTTAEIPAMARLWRRAGQGDELAACKGAPETLARLCGLAGAELDRMRHQVDELAAGGLRVLAVGSGRLHGERPPARIEELQLEYQGLVGFRDPPRPEAAAAVAQAREAGIVVAMITGDHPVTATAIAREVGIDTAAPPLSGADLDGMDEAALAAAVRRARVFARIRPEQKLRLVEAFKAGGEVVAMTGDGVNDAPALRAAHIGIAMGRRGTDVAREAADIVLLDDNAGSVLAGIRTGRRIFDNLRKAMLYIVAIHLPVAGMALLPLLLGLPPLLLPLHVVLVEMVVDPVCSIAFEAEPEEPGIMQRPPRPRDAALLGWPQFMLALLQGSLLLVASLALYMGALGAGLGEDSGRSLAFIALTAGNLMLVRVDATRGAALPRLLERSHVAYWIIAAIATGVTALVMLVPPLAAAFHFGPVSAGQVLIAVLTGAFAVLAFDLIKPIAVVRRALGGT